MNFKVVSEGDSFPPIIDFETIVKLNAGNDEVRHEEDLGVNQAMS